jgi:predicted  nucleic acid-binding Zn-ribbon protein
MKKCLLCGHTVEDKTATCPKCGEATWAALPKQDEEKDGQEGDGEDKQAEEDVSPPEPEPEPEPEPRPAPVKATPKASPVKKAGKR